jgi:hypothetical protein
MIGKLINTGIAAIKPPVLEKLMIAVIIALRANILQRADLMGIMVACLARPTSFLVR